MKPTHATVPGDIDLDALTDITPGKTYAITEWVNAGQFAFIDDVGDGRIGTTRACGVLAGRLWLLTTEPVPSDRLARLERERAMLRSALEGLMPEGWGDGTMDHMPGIAQARTALAATEEK
jgi:hypothetical protein